MFRIVAILLILGTGACGGGPTAAPTAQIIFLSGRIAEQGTDLPVPDVTVSVYRIEPPQRPDVLVASALTDSDGRYQLTFTHSCRPSQSGLFQQGYGLKIWKTGSPNLWPVWASETPLWPLGNPLEDFCSRTSRVIDIEVTGL